MKGERETTVQGSVSATMNKIQSVARLMLAQGLANLAISALVLSETVSPEPTGTWYWLLGPCSLASGVVAIVAGRRNLNLQSRGMGLFALGLLGLSGLGAYKLPTGIIISGLGIYLYLQRDTRDAFRDTAGAAGEAAAGRQVR